MFFSLSREFLNTLDVLGESVGQLLTVLHVTDGSQLDIRERLLHLIRGRLQLSVIRVSHLNTLIIVQGALLHERVPGERVACGLAKPIQLLRIGERIPYRGREGLHGSSTHFTTVKVGNFLNNVAVRELTLHRVRIERLECREVLVE